MSSRDVFSDNCISLELLKKPLVLYAPDELLKLEATAMNAMLVPSLYISCYYLPCQECSDY